MKNDNKVRNVSKVSGVSKMSKQGAQQSRQSLLPMGEGGRRPDEGADVVRSYTLETGRLACTNTQINAKDIQNLSVIPQQFECNTPEPLLCGISNEEHKLFLACETCAAKK